MTVQRLIVNNYLDGVTETGQRNVRVRTSNDSLSIKLIILGRKSAISENAFPALQRFHPVSRDNSGADLLGTVVMRACESWVEIVKNPRRAVRFQPARQNSAWTLAPRRVGSSASDARAADS